jgi:hypothetical protein
MERKKKTKSAAVAIKNWFEAKFGGPVGAPQTNNCNSLMKA